VPRTVSSPPGFAAGDRGSGALGPRCAIRAGSPFAQERYRLRTAEPLNDFDCPAGSNSVGSQIGAASPVQEHLDPALALG
jgi:hypothetical protein